jgi:hypothetical protein
VLSVPTFSGSLGMLSTRTLAKYFEAIFAIVNEFAFVRGDILREFALDLRALEGLGKLVDRSRYPILVSRSSNAAERVVRATRKSAVVCLSAGSYCHGGIYKVGTVPELAFL